MVICDVRESDKMTMDSRRMKVLVKLPNYVGDVLMSLPALHAIRELFPSSEGHTVDLLSEERFSYLLYKQGCFDEFIAQNRDPHKVRPADVGAILKARRRYDLAISLTRQRRFVQGFKNAGIPIRAGYTSFENRWWLTLKIPEPLGAESAAGGGQTEYYLNLVRIVAEEVCGKSLPIVQNAVCSFLHVKDEWLESALAIVANGLVEIKQAENANHAKSGRSFPWPFYVLVVGTAKTRHGTLKRWPLWNFVKVVERMSAAEIAPRPIPLFLFGPDGRNLYEEFVQDYQDSLIGPTIVIKPGSMRLGHVSAIIQHSEFVLSNDTGPRHMATRLGTKVVTVFGPCSLSRAVYSSDLEYPVWVDVGCNQAECTTKKCRENHICLTAVTPGLVCSKIIDFVYNTD